MRFDVLEDASNTRKIEQQQDANENSTTAEHPRTHQRALLTAVPRVVETRPRASYQSCSVGIEGVHDSAFCWRWKYVRRARWRGSYAGQHSELEPHMQQVRTHAVSSYVYGGYERAIGDGLL